MEIESYGYTVSDVVMYWRVEPVVGVEVTTIKHFSAPVYVFVLVFLSQWVGWIIYYSVSIVLRELADGGVGRLVIGLTYIILVSQTQLLRRPAFHGRDCLLPFAFLTSSQQLISEITKPSLVLLFFSIHKLIFYSCGYILYSPCLSRLNILFIIIRPLYCLFILVCPLNVPPPIPHTTPCFWTTSPP